MQVCMHHSCNATQARSAQGSASAAQARHWQEVAEGALSQQDAEASAAAVMHDGAQRARSHAQQALAWVRRSRLAPENHRALAFASTATGACRLIVAANISLWSRGYLPAGACVRMMWCTSTGAAAEGRGAGGGRGPAAGAGSQCRAREGEAAPGRGPAEQHRRASRCALSNGTLSLLTLCNFRLSHTACSAALMWPAVVRKMPCRNGAIAAEPAWRAGCRSFLSTCAATAWRSG